MHPPLKVATDASLRNPSRTAARRVVPGDSDPHRRVVECRSPGTLQILITEGIP